MTNNTEWEAFISHSLQAGTYKIKMAVNTFPDGSSHPGLQIATFSLRPHREEKERALLCLLFLRTPIPSLEPHSHDLI